MIRLACALGLIAIVMAVILVLRTDGASAIGFSFIGAPALGLALTIYGVSRWRAGVSGRTPRVLEKRVPNPDEAPEPSHRRFGLNAFNWGRL